jgi:hypothetical protein
MQFAAAEILDDLEAFTAEARNIVEAVNRADRMSAACR